MSVEELLQYAHKHKVNSMALTDINNTSGCMDFLRLAPKYNIHAVIGIDFRHDTEQLYIGIAKNNKGFQELNEFLSGYRMAHKELPKTPPFMPNCFIVFPWKKSESLLLKENEFIGLRPNDISAFRLYGKQYAPDKIVILNSVSFRDKKDFNKHRLLRAIYHNALLSKLTLSQQGEIRNTIYAGNDLIEKYSGFEKAALTTESLLTSSSVYFEFGKSKNKACYTNTKEEDYSLLERLAVEGLQYRYKKPTEIVMQRFYSELKTIIDLGFTAYFLINWDIVRFAQSKGFYYVGRGSGSNSLIAYCLRITDVDPIELDLYFERFINPSRKSPPDFDIDFSHTDRDAVREYIFEKYKGHVALVGSYNTFERKSCIRELGKVFGLPDAEIDALQVEQPNIKALDETGKIVLKYAPLLHGLPNLLSVHACGILISENPITCFTALELMPVGFPSTQFSMLEAEDVGLYKFDILSQRGLGHIKDAVELIRTNQNINIDIHRIQDFKNDTRIKELLKGGNTIGCFYVESPAMRQLLRKLLVQDYLGLVAASSVIRPGVASSGMMREYILRYRYPQKRKDAHPKLLAIMPETYGVMVYQEDVIKVAHYYAGLTLEEAEVMRRGMSGKFRSRAEFQTVKNTFFKNCKFKEYPDDEVAEIWRQIESFAGYSFAKGHSASYAVESYQSLFLRAYYPIEFMTGVINNYGGFYSTEFYLHEAKMLGAVIELPCVNSSNYHAFLSGITIFIGLGLIKDLEQATINNILVERNRNGLFTSLNDFVKRVSISLEQIRILIRIKAFRFIGKSSKELLWDAHMMLSKAKKTVPVKELFKVEPTPNKLPPLEYSPFEDVLNEMQILSFPYTSPFKILERNYEGTVFAAELITHLGNVVYIVGYYINIKRVETIHGDTMYFGCFTDSKGQLFDTVHFPASIDRYPFTGKGCYLIKGTVIEDFDVPSIDVSNMIRINWAFKAE
jgi:DNA-directed DNA polymerase III PolC